MKRKWLILIITGLIIALFMSFGLAQLEDSCEEKLVPGKNCTMYTPYLSCSLYNYTILNTTGIVEEKILTLIETGFYYLVFNQSKGDYVVQLCDDSTREIIVGGTDNMGSLAITIFILLITGTIFYLPFVKKFSDNPLTNLIISRSLWVCGIFLMIFNTAIMATIADVSGLGINQELFTYMWFFEQIGYVSLVILIFISLVDITKTWKVMKEEKRFGEHYSDGFKKY